MSKHWIGVVKETGKSQEESISGVGTQKQTWR